MRSLYFDEERGKKKGRLIKEEREEENEPSQTRI